MKKTISLIFSIIIISGCNFYSKSEKKLKTSKELKLDCKCYNGIGSNENSKPIYTFQFLDKNTISICGYSEENTISEFNIFNCKTGKSIVEYGAIQNCKIVFKKNKIEIIELVNLPTNDNWEYSFVEIGLQTLSSNNTLLNLSEQKPLKVKHTISEKAQTEFLRKINNEGFKSFETDDLISKLEILTIYGNTKAEEILLNLERQKEITIDGALAEHYHEALARINWIKN